MSERRPWTERDELRLAVRYGLTKGLALVHGMRRQLSEEERDRIASAIIEYLELANYRVERGPPMPMRVPTSQGRAGSE